MSEEKKRNELGKLLACLLVSRKEACTIKDLERDYFNNEGRSIPYREFGCISSIEFLRTIPNHVIIDNRNGMHWVYPVVSDKVKHVNDLVSRQKNAKKSTPVRRRPNRPPQYFPAVRASKPFFPNNLQKEVAQILTINASGVNKNYIIQCLQQSQAFSGIVDFSNIDKYLESVSHIAIVNGNMVYPSRSLIASIQSGQRNLPLSNGIDQAKSGVRDSPEHVPKNNNCQTSNWCPGGLEEGEVIDDDEDLAIDNNSQAFNKNELWKDNFNSMNVSPATATEQSAFHEEHRQIMENHSESACHQATQLEYEDLRDGTGYESQCTFTSDEDEAMNIISPRIMLRLQQLIKKHPEGIWCADLPQTYLEEYKVGLDYAELGFSSVGQLASKLQNIFTCHRWDDFGDFILYDANSPLPQPPNKLKSHSRTIVWENELDDDEVDPFPMALPLHTSQRLIPDDVLSLRESVGQERIPIFTNDERCLEVLVSEVFTPSFFYIHLRKKRITLCQLMDNMNEFYQQQGDNYTIPLVVLEKGLNCVCIFQDKWHRAIIKTVKPDGDVMLSFYDFGTIKTYPADSIRFLHKKYSNLPAQAIPCGLFNIKPINSQLWSKGVSSDFWLKIEDVPLIAIVAKVDEENNSMLVSLVDTQGEDDLHINDWMVQQGYAEFGSMVRIRPPNFVLRHAIACAIFNKRMRTAQLIEKVNAQAAATAVNRSDSESGSSSKVKLKSANYVKSLIAKHSKYKKNSNSITNGLSNNISENKVATCKGDTTSVPAESCVATNVPVLETVNTSEPIIAEDKIIRKLECEVKPIIPKNIELRFIEERNNVNGLASATSVARLSRASHNSAVHETSVTVQNCIQNEEGDRLPFSGTFRSFFGGHGYMKPIDWSTLRSIVQLEKESMKPKRRVELQTVAASPLFNLSEETKSEPVAEFHEGDTVVLECTYLDDQKIYGQGPTEVSDNVPVFLPQTTFSTTSANTLKPPPGFTKPPEPTNFAANIEEYLEGKNYTTAETGKFEVPNIFNVNLNNNLFSSQDTKYDPLVFSPETILKCWKQRMEIDMQLTAAFFNQLLLLSSPSTNPFRHEQQTNNFTIPTEHPINQSTMEPNSTNIDNVNTLPYSEGVQNITSSNEKFPGLNEQQLLSSNSTMPSKQNTGPITNSNPTWETKNCFSTECLSQSLPSIHNTDINFNNEPVINKHTIHEESSKTLMNEENKFQNINSFHVFNSNSSILDTGKHDLPTTEKYNSTENSLLNPTVPPFKMTIKSTNSKNNLSTSNVFEEQQLRETNPFRQLVIETSTSKTEDLKEKSLKRTADCTNGMSRPPIPPRNPNLINKNGYVAPHKVTDITHTPSTNYINQQNIPTPKIYYTAEPVMYKVQTNKTIETNCELNKKPTTLTKSVTLEDNIQQANGNSSYDLTNKSSSTNTLFGLGKTTSPLIDQKSFPLGHNFTVNSPQISDISTPKREQGLNPRTLQNSYQPPPPSFLESCPAEYQPRRQTISPRFTYPEPSEISKAAIAEVEKVSKLDFYEKWVPTATLNTPNVQSENNIPENVGFHNKHTSPSPMANNSTIIPNSSTVCSPKPSWINSFHRIDPITEKCQQRVTNFEEKLLDNLCDKSVANKTMGLASGTESTAQIFANQDVILSNTSVIYEPKTLATSKDEKLDKLTSEPSNNSEETITRRNTNNYITPQTHVNTDTAQTWIPSINWSSMLEPQALGNVSQYPQNDYNSSTVTSRRGKTDNTKPTGTALNSNPYLSPPQVQSTGPLYPLPYANNPLQKPVQYAFPTQQPYMMQPPHVPQRTPLFTPGASGLYPPVDNRLKPQLTPVFGYPHNTYVHPQLHSQPWNFYTPYMYPQYQQTHFRNAPTPLKPHDSSKVAFKPETVLPKLNQNEQVPTDVPKVIPTTDQSATPTVSIPPSNSHPNNISNVKDCKFATHLLGVSTAAASQKTSENETQTRQTLPCTSSINYLENSTQKSKNTPPPPDRITNFFKPVEVNDQTVYLFNFDNEGWVCTDEILLVFTSYEHRSAILRLLEIIDVKINFKEVDRAQSPHLFSQLDSTTIKLPRMPNTKKIKGVLHLTPLKSLMRLMFRLNIVSEEEITRLSAQQPPEFGSKMHQLVKLVMAYKSDDEYWIS